MSKKIALAIVLLLFSSVVCSFFSSEGAVPTATITEVVEQVADTDVPPTASPTHTEIPPTLTTKPSSTPTEEPTATFTPTEYIPSSGDRIFSTDFSALENWSIEKAYEEQVGYEIEIQSDGLFIVVPEANDGIWLYYDSQPELSDVRIKADVELVGGTNYTYIELMCRSTEVGEYIFFLDTGGYWQIGKYTSSYEEYEQLAYGGSTAINLAKASNKIEVECSENNLTFFINGEEEGKVQDDEFTTGSVGIGVETFDYPDAQVMFKGLEVVVP